MQADVFGLIRADDARALQPFAYKSIDSGGGHSCFTAGQHVQLTDDLGVFRERGQNVNTYRVELSWRET